MNMFSLVILGVLFIGNMNCKPDGDEVSELCYKFALKKSAVYTLSLNTIENNKLFSEQFITFSFDPLNVDKNAATISAKILRIKTKSKSTVFKESTYDSKFPPKEPSILDEIKTFLVLKPFRLSIDKNGKVKSVEGLSKLAPELLEKLKIKIELTKMPEGSKERLVKFINKSVSNDRYAKILDYAFYTTLKGIKDGKSLSGDEMMIPEMPVADILVKYRIKRRCVKGDIASIEYEGGKEPFMLRGKQEVFCKVIIEDWLDNKKIKIENVNVKGEVIFKNSKNLLISHKSESDVDLNINGRKVNFKKNMVFKRDEK